MSDSTVRLLVALLCACLAICVSWRTLWSKRISHPTITNTILLFPAYYLFYVFGNVGVYWLWRGDSFGTAALRILLVMGLVGLPPVLTLTLLLLLLLPPLRKRVSAEGCVVLWNLPFLVLFILVLLSTFWFSIFAGEPRFVIRIPKGVAVILLWFWIGGFLAVLGGKIWSHIRFRRLVLREAKPVTDAEHALFRHVWCRLVENKEDKERDFRVLRSPAVTSPLTIGMSNLCLILPDKHYSQADLMLIFRHESIHLLRCDNLLKFSISCFCAVGWFIPSLWLGMRKASEDLELCCDRLVTDGMDEEARKHYAAVLLSDVGSAPGFTTCLSASASGLRYRINRVLHLQSRRKGAVAVTAAAALFTAAVVALLGTAALSLDTGTVQTLFLEQEANWHVAPAGTYVPASYDSYDSYTKPSSTTYYCAEPEIVEAYVSQLRLTEPMWFDLQGDDFLSFEFHAIPLQAADGRTAWLCFREPTKEGYAAYCYVLTEANSDKEIEEYRVVDEVDFQWLSRLLSAVENE